MPKTNETIRIEELYDQYAHLVYRRCVLILGNQADAEDALQEVFIRAMKSSASFRGESSPMTWLFRISTNHCLNVIRSSKRRKAKLDTKAKESAVFSSSSSDAMEQIATVREILPRFNERIQKIAIHYYVDEMNLEEVAREVDASVPTVRKYLKKFLKQAKKHYLENGK